MATLVADELFSDSYMDAFYKAHISSSRSRGSGTLDEDIAAIEAEIRKVHQYRSKFQSYRFEHNNLNSCGNSECSDEDDFEDSSSTSVFKVYNSSSSGVEGMDTPYSQQNHHKTPDVFTWAASQQVHHDHGYCMESTAPDTPSQSTKIDHGTLSMTDIHWHQLSPSKRAQAIEKLSCILQQKPSGRQSPTISSLDLLPTSLVNWIRTTGTLGLNACKTPLLPAPPTKMNNNLPHSAKNNFQKIGNKFRSRNTGQQHPVVTARPIDTKYNTTSKKKPSPPYGQLTRHINIEVTRVRNISSCSDGEDPVIID